MWVHPPYLGSASHPLLTSRRRSDDIGAVKFIAAPEVLGFKGFRGAVGFGVLRIVAAYLAAPPLPGFSLYTGFKFRIWHKILGCVQSLRVVHVWPGVGFAAVGEDEMHGTVLLVKGERTGRNGGDASTQRLDPYLRQIRNLRSVYKLNTGKYTGKSSCPPTVKPNTNGKSPVGGVTSLVYV